MDYIKVGNYIKELRKRSGMRQIDLANKCNVTNQAVSKWENGVTLPDASILLDLASILNTTVDSLLNGGVIINDKRKLMSVGDIVNGFSYIENIKKCFGGKSLFYKGLVEGVNNKMNFDLEDGLLNHREVLYTEVILQGIINENKTVDMNDVKCYIKNDKLVKMIEEKIKNL